MFYGLEFGGGRIKNAPPYETSILQNVTQAFEIGRNRVIRVHLDLRGMMWQKSGENRVIG
jgi:hypothetical protein